MKELDITDGLAKSVWKSLNEAVDSKNADTIYEFISFFTSILRDSLQYKKIKYFKQFILFPSQIYSRIAFRSSENTSYQILVRQISEQLSLHLREIIDFYIGIIGKTYSTTEEKEIINAFYYEAFYSYNNLLYRQTKNKDWALLTGSIKRYSLLGQGLFLPNMQEELKLRNLVDDPIAKNSEDINRIRLLIQNAGIFNRFKRQPVSAIKYWLLLLFDQGLLETETMINLLTDIGKIDGYDPIKEVEDILFFRTGDLRSYMGWEDWDFEDRPEGDIYFPPMPSQWMTRGFTIDRIRSRNAYFNTDQVSPELIRDIPFLYDSVSENIDSIRRAFGKWQRVLQVQDIAEFDLLANELRASIALAKRSFIGEKEQFIVNAPLSQARIEEFKNKMGNAWKQQLRIRKIFSYFGNMEDVTGQDVLLKLVGRNMFLEKSKIMFIDGEYYSYIHGTEQIGGQVARWEDDLFMDVIQKANPVIIEESTLLETLTKCINQLQNDGTVPTMILLEPTYLYKDDVFLKSERYSAQYNDDLNPDNINFFLLGTFDNIPLFTSYSVALKSRVVVGDFAAAFKMLHKTDQAWFENELSIKVLEVSDELANEKFRQAPSKWRLTDGELELSEKDAKTLIKTSIIVDIETITDFTVIDVAKYNIGQISEPTAD